jgi:hypothetical protein
LHPFGCGAATWWFCNAHKKTNATVIWLQAWILQQAKWLHELLLQQNTWLQYDNIDTNELVAK